VGVLEPGTEALLQHHRDESLVAVALVVGTVELLQVLSALLSLNSGFWAWLNDVDFGTLGYGIVALFVLTWTLSYGIWKVRRIEERWTSLIRSR
jgi:nickel/cobalt transporter (NiCoT) family protein